MSDIVTIGVANTSNALISKTDKLSATAASILQNNLSGHSSNELTNSINLYYETIRNKLFLKFITADFESVLGDLQVISKYTG